VYAEDDGGGRLDAEYKIERDGDQVALVLESASGASSRRPARNTQYRPALELLLERLKNLDAVLEDALVDSAYTQRLGLPEDERRIAEGPLPLSEQLDMAKFRKLLTNRQAQIGQRSDARRDGNTTKRIRLRLTVPGYGPSEASVLETLLASAIDRFEYQSADETEPELGQTFPEGSVTRVTVNKYERDPAARKECLKKYGHKCTVCELDFEVQYGDIGKDFIHVHHLKELSKVGAGYAVNPLEDLRPVCPNCHAMLHKRRPAYTPEELKQMLRRSPANS
jgi:HNH endonuclease